MRPFIDKVCKNRELIERNTEQILPTVFLERLQQILLPYFSQAYLDANLVLPEAFLIYLETVKGSLDSDWEWFGDSASVLYMTKDFCESWCRGDFLDRKKKGISKPNDTIWLKFGAWSDKHEWIICCDKSNPKFGWVFDCYDDHPLSNGERFLTNDEFDSFMEFVLKKFA